MNSHSPPSSYYDPPAEPEDFGETCPGVVSVVCGRCNGSGIDPGNDPSALAKAEALHQAYLFNTGFLVARERAYAALLDCTACFGEGKADDICGAPLPDGYECGECGYYRPSKTRADAPGWEE